MRSLLIALLVLLWLILGWLYFQDHKRCCSAGMELSDVPLVSEKTGAILFTWGNTTPVLGESWPRMRDSLAALATDSTSLEIAGWYCRDAKPDENDSTGYFRARETRKLFPDIPDERIIILSKEMDCDSSYATSRFESLSFSQRKRTENIKEIDDRILIYFLSNSTRKLNNAEVESYLDDVAARVKKSGETIMITGHTDATGPTEANQVLGRKRAEIVGMYLEKKGVSADQMKITSKGESTPIADNLTDVGKAKNRRTELQIIK